MKIFLYRPINNMKHINFAALLLLCFPIWASAHHSTATNFTREIIEISGVLKEVRFLNPHISMLIESTNSTGEPIFFLVESDARSTYERKGINLLELPEGTSVTVSGRKGIRPYTLYLRTAIFSDGTRFTSDGVEE